MNHDSTLPFISVTNHPPAALDKTKNYFNMSSYNYLGFAENSGPCLNQAVSAVGKYGVAAAGKAGRNGTTKNPPIP